MNDNGGPAFPSAATARDEWTGMSLRDYFAGQALQGMCARFTNAQIASRADGTMGGAIVSKAAYVIADAMLTERNKP